MRHRDQRVIEICTGGRLRRLAWSLAIAAALAPLLVRAYRIARAELAASGGTVEAYTRAVGHDPGNAQLWWTRGRLRHYSLGGANLDAAIGDYRRALALNPRLGQTWADLADALERKGDTAGAAESLARAVRAWRYSPIIHWQAGNFHLLQGDLDAMYEHFRTAVEYDPGKLRIALQTVWQADPDHTRLLTGLVPDRLPANVEAAVFLASRDELDLAGAAWRRAVRNPVPDEFRFKPAHVFSYLDRLLGKKRVAEALAVWEETLRKTGARAPDPRLVRQAGGVQALRHGTNLVWNGSFEEDSLRGGFDWRWPEMDDVDLTADIAERCAGLKSLRLTFREVNLNHSLLSQVVPTLEPGVYTLEFRIRAENLTTDQRPFFVVRGYPDIEREIARTPLFPQVTGWTTCSVSFRVSPGRGAVELVLRRMRSQKFDNRITGSLWLDDVRVQRQEREDLEAPR